MGGKKPGDTKKTDRALCGFGLASSVSFPASAVLAESGLPGRQILVNNASLVRRKKQIKTTAVSAQEVNTLSAVSRCRLFVDVVGRPACGWFA